MTLTKEQKVEALAEFMLYFVKNYPGPHTIITNPYWHAPKIFKAALAALESVGEEEITMAGLLTKLIEKWRRGCEDFIVTGVRRLGDPESVSDCVDELEAELPAIESELAELRAQITAIEIMLSGVRGAALNAVIEDYPEMWAKVATRERLVQAAALKKAAENICEWCCEGNVPAENPEFLRPGTLWHKIYANWIVCPASGFLSFDKDGQLLLAAHDAELCLKIEKECSDRLDSQAEAFDAHVWEEIDKRDRLVEAAALRKAADKAQEMWKNCFCPVITCIHSLHD